MEWPNWWTSISDTLTFTPLSTFSQTKILTGIPLLDHNTGGLVCGSIYEISGEAGTGKTNLCLQISKSISVQSQVIYLSTLKPLSNSRLSSIGLNSPNFVHRDYRDLKDIINFIIEELPRHSIQGLKLFILDNIYTLAQCEDLDPKEKASLTQRLSIILKYLSFQYKFAVIIVNNVVSTNSATIPGLGLNWSYCVNHRWFLSKNNSQRKLRVLFSCTSQWECEIFINNESVELTEPN